ncbi:MAG: ABC transporter ATP-binding protein [Planctomycetota bacterium]
MPAAGSAASSAKPVCACQRLSKTFKDFWLRERARAVDEVSFEIRQGEVFGLLGPNGSGKSTTIKIILGLLKPSGGRVAVFGKPPSDVKTKKRIGYLPEESYLYGFLNARETLDYYGKLFELDGKIREQRIDELLEMVGLTHVQHRPVRDYSKGMQRRIGIAQALINDPDFLILDEPTTGLDPIGTRQVKDLILELGRRGKTILLSSHLLADVEDVVDRMVILYGGKIRGEGTCDELLMSMSKTTIETDALDDETIAEIDEVIRRRTGGEHAIGRVSHPRQKLEELFLSIVEKAQRERSETAGAVHSGNTAAFLKADEQTSEERAEALISDLVAGDDETPLAPMAVEGQEAEEQAAAAEAQAEAASSDAVIADLMGESTATGDGNPADDQSAPQAPADRSESKPLPADVDLDVIGSLVDESAGGDDDEERRGS